MNALDLLRQQLPAWGVDAVLVPHEDQYLNEYLPPWAEILTWLCGFTGSAGTAAVTGQEAALFVDSRYTIQAKNELDSKKWTSFLINNMKPETWLPGKAKRVGYDPSCFSQSRADILIETFAAKGIEAVALPVGAVHGLMNNKSNAHDLPVDAFPVKFEGRDAHEKLKLIRAELAHAGVDAALIADPSLVSWALGIRGRVTKMTPLALARALVTKDKLFVQLDPVHAQSLPVDAVIGALPSFDGLVGYDPDTTPPASLIAYKNIKPLKGLFQKLRAAKTPQSRAVIKEVLRRDNKILDKFFKGLIQYLQANTAYEHEIAEMIAAARAKHPLYVEESFDAIVGFRENGAIIHYRPQKGSDKLVKGRGVLLIDCGGQYQDGTTDRTTTILLDPTAEEKRVYEAVVKAHKTLASAKFPVGTTGAQLDGICKKPLWDAGYDCPHGIGHGVGQFLSVHEGPFSISPRGSQPVPEGLLVSNEPGVYIEGKFGVRHERLYFVEAVGDGSGLLQFTS